MALPLTIKDIARLSGVGISTVSRVLNNRPDVSEETRMKVLSVVNNEGYTPNSNAKHLKQRNTNYIGVIVRGTKNTFLYGLLEQLQHCIGETEYQFLPWYIDEHGDEIRAAQELYSERKVQGIIFLGGSVQGREEDLSHFPVPCVFATADASSIHAPSVMSVTVDDRRAAATAIEYLLSLGHRRIAVVGGAVESRNLIGLRYQGVLDSFEAHGLAFDPSLYLTSGFSMGSAYEATRQALEQGKHFTALFAMSDSMAMGASKAVSDAGLSVPGDISLIGYDGIELASYLTPTLATMRQPVGQIASECMRLIRNALIGYIPDQDRHITLSATLIPGQSVRQL